MNSKSFDVVALGELLIDFTENGASSQGNGLFGARSGGAPCNVLAMLCKLNKPCAFVGKVGDDIFGRLLRGTIAEAGINADTLVTDPKIPTTLAFVKTFPNGDRDFSFYRKPGALVSFDPNLRPPLWESMEEAKTQIAWGLSRCDILKNADNELEFMTGETDFIRGTAILYEKYPNIKVLNVTAGANGSYSFYGEEEPVFVPSFKLSGTIETTEAGDTFCASVLNFILENGIVCLTAEDRKNMLRFANAAAYIVTTRKGAIRSMPECTEVEALLAAN